jgi:predicted enzyme related to lactoylglutathione lyase
MTNVTQRDQDSRSPREPIGIDGVLTDTAMETPNEGVMMIAYSAARLIPISDCDQALDFYLGTLGFEKRAETGQPDGSRLIEIATPGARRSITLARARRPRQESHAGQFVGVVLGTSDIHATYRRLRARGVTFIEPPTAQREGMLQAQFLDRDGNSLMLIQP